MEGKVAMARLLAVARAWQEIRAPLSADTELCGAAIDNARLFIAMLDAATSAGNVKWPLPHPEEYEPSDGEIIAAIDKFIKTWSHGDRAAMRSALIAAAKVRSAK